MVSYVRPLANRRGCASLLLSCGLALTGCGPGSAVYTRESFSTDSPYQKGFGVPAATACEGARRALLGDGYVIDSAGGESVKGRKAYRSDADRSTFVEMSVVCVADPAGSSLYANGLLSTYDVKTSTSSASVGISAIGSVSLPFGRSAESMVKTSDETISDRAYYQRFFAAVQAALDAMHPDRAVAGGRSEPGPGAAGEAQQTLAPGDAGRGPAPGTPRPAGRAAAVPVPLPAPPESPAPVPIEPRGMVGTPEGAGSGVRPRGGAGRAGRRVRARAPGAGCRVRADRCRARRRGRAGGCPGGRGILACARRARGRYGGTGSHAWGGGASRRGPVDGHPAGRRAFPRRGDARARYSGGSGGGDHTRGSRAGCRGRAVPWPGGR